ncbi:hypothetical protein LCGC14_1104170 [marine sediment metagenome]|uniref:Uncharacterized protein n=1 Tax=marine sediment metagenome TaxID=412755 RepID=A0A0F9M8P7_9ZZZZ
MEWSGTNAFQKTIHTEKGMFQGFLTGKYPGMYTVRIEKVDSSLTGDSELLTTNKFESPHEAWASAKRLLEFHVGEDK